MASLMEDLLDVLEKEEKQYQELIELGLEKKQAVIKAGQYAYRDRKQRKRQFRALWIARINAGARINGLSYSRLIAGLKKASIEIDRKVLADLAVNEKAAFAAIVEKAKASLA